ncbi:MAG: hypothetical protein ACREDL_23745 [Bradyrhizobium sp.]
MAGPDKADRFDQPAADILAPEFFDVGLRPWQKVLHVIFDINFGDYINRVP